MLGLFTALVVVLWAFPNYWYKAPKEETQFVWLVGQTNLPDWSFHEIPIGKAAEAVLAGDRMVNGEFAARQSARKIQVFSAQGYVEKDNRIGLFSHTPDRCWTGAGWRIQPTEPEWVDCTIRGVRIRFERRLFVHGGQEELCYFGALVGGKPLPYRLDQYLDSSLRKFAKKQGHAASTWLRVTSGRMWRWTWDSFVNRTAFEGPQQFFRISTSVKAEDLVAADQSLREFLPLWLKQADFQTEREKWEQAQREKR